MRAAKRGAKLVEQYIERAYYKHAAGKQINMLDIPKVFRDAHAALANGEDLDAAMAAIVLRYCTEAR